MVRRSRLVIFYFKEKFCDSHALAIDTRSHLRDAYFQSVQKTLSKKKSFLRHIIADQSFYGALLTISYFYFEEKFFVSHASASHLRDVCFQSVLKTLSKK